MARGLGHKDVAVATVGQNTGHARLAPGVLRWWRAVLFHVFRHETRNQSLRRGFVRLVLAELVRIRYGAPAALGRRDDAAAADVGGWTILCDDRLHGIGVNQG